MFICKECLQKRNQYTTEYIDNEARLSVSNCDVCFKMVAVFKVKKFVERKSKVPIPEEPKKKNKFIFLAK
jgi:hypothetical protein